MDREFIINKLRENVCTVVFEKTNGDQRIMECTLSSRCIPEDKRPNGNGKVKPDHIINAFDVELGDWRSFNLDKIISFDVDFVA